jgi:hypothetical protein
VNLTQKTIKILTLNENQDLNFYESCLRLLKTLALSKLFSVEKCFSSGFLNEIDEYLLNDICFQYISSNKLNLFF